MEKGRRKKRKGMRDKWEGLGRGRDVMEMVG